MVVACILIALLCAEPRLVPRFNDTKSTKSHAPRRRLSLPAPLLLLLLDCLRDLLVSNANRVGSKSPFHDDDDESNLPYALCVCLQAADTKYLADTLT